MFDSVDRPGRGADTATPGPFVSVSLHCDPDDLTGAELVDAIAESERALSAVTAWQMRALAALAVPGVAGDPTGIARRGGRRLPGGQDDPDPDAKSVAAHEAAQSMAAGEVAAALRVSPVTTGMKVRNAIRMCTELPATLDALASGSIDRGKALVISEYTAPLPVYLLDIVQGMVLPTAQTKTTAATRKAVAAAVIALDPRGAEDRHEAEHRGRTLVLQPEPDGMSTLKAYLAADAAAGIYQLADLLATQTVGFADDDRSIGARRVDALADLAGEILTHGCVDLADYLTPDSLPAPDSALSAGAATGDRAVTDTSGTDTSGGTGNSGTDTSGSGTSGSTGSGSSGSTAHTASETGHVGPDSAAAAADAPVAPAAANARATRRLSRQGRRPHLQVTLGLSTLAGLDDLPAELAGHGAITAGMARSIATSAGSLCSLLADETTGAVIAAGSYSYRPRQDLRDQLTALVDSCRFPSCRQPVWRCDIDHRNPYNHHNPPAGGRTTVANTDPLCRRHHLFKHHTAWTLRRDTPSPADPAGLGVTWTSPTGHTYNDPPRQVTIPGTWSSLYTGDPTAHPGDQSAEVDPDPADGRAADPSAGSTVDPAVACGGEMRDSAVGKAAGAGVDPAPGSDIHPGTGGIADPATGCDPETDAVVDTAVAAALCEACRSIPGFLEHRRLQVDPGSRTTPILGSRGQAETSPEPADTDRGAGPGASTGTGTGTDPGASTCTDTDSSANPGASSGTDSNSSADPGSRTDGSPADPSAATQDAPFSGLGEADLVSLLLRLYLITRPPTGDAHPASGPGDIDGLDNPSDALGGEPDDDPPPF